MRRLFYFFLSIIVVSTVSCSSPQDREELVKKTVSRYANAVTSAYKEGKFDLLTEVAAGKALQTVDNTYQSYLNGKGMVLDAELIGMTFDDVALGSGKEGAKIKTEWHEKEKEWREVRVFKETLVNTSERWEYRWVDHKTGELASPVVTVSYKVRYTIDLVDGKFKVVLTEIKEENVEKTEGDNDKWKTKTGEISGAH